MTIRQTVTSGELSAQAADERFAGSPWTQPLSGPRSKLHVASSARLGGEMHLWVPKVATCSTGIGRGGEIVGGAAGGGALTEATVGVEDSVSRSQVGDVQASRCPEHPCSFVAFVSGGVTRAERRWPVGGGSAHATPPHHERLTSAAPSSVTNQYRWHYPVGPKCIL